MASGGVAAVLVSAILLSFLQFAPAGAAEKVSLALYYEALCPFCSNFIVNYLPKIFENGIVSIVDIDLVPYGNARIDLNGTITCQHGPYECFLNTVEACAIKAWPDLNEHFRFIYCVERLAAERKYGEWESCFHETGLDSKDVLGCYDSGQGEQLELQYAAKTDALQPPHRYVPWVTVNGEPLYDNYEDFEQYICKAYEGELPDACKELTLINTGIKAYRGAGKSIPMKIRAL